MRITYTLHATHKFTHEKYVNQLKITKSIIRAAIEKPFFENQNYNGKVIALGSLTGSLTLMVIYKHEGDIIKVITYYPIEKGGNYENKILQKR